VDPIELALLRDLLESVAEEMAITCRRTAVSPNIKERRDLSAALFDGAGRLLAHAAHIPVHLGAMPRSVEAVRAAMTLRPGEAALVNDPYTGGSHLPDLTLVRAVHDDAVGAVPCGYLAVRAHHADVGGAVPGSMAPQDDIHAEGLRIPPLVAFRGDDLDPVFATLFLANVRHATEREADLRAQAGSLAQGEARLRAIAARRGGLAALLAAGGQLIAYAHRMVGGALAALPDRTACVEVGLDATDRRGRPAVLRLRLTKQGGRIAVDFDGTTGPVGDGLNAPRAVTESAVYYLLACLAPPHTPPNAGLLDAATLTIPAGCLLDAQPPQPVAGGNVETSQRVVDALWLAAAACWPERIPAPGAGSMSNWTFGPVPDGPAFPVYYETLPGGAGGGPRGPGPAAIQQHMTNTRSTPVEELERRWPVRVLAHAVRPDSGGTGRAAGGDGLLREVLFLAPARVAFLMTRHDAPPPGVAGGGPGQPGRLTWIRGRRRRRLAPRSVLRVEAGDVLRIETPGGGACGPRHQGLDPGIHG
jgi:N-methylhydantoinase B